MPTSPIDFNGYCFPLSMTVSTSFSRSTSTSCPATRKWACVMCAHRITCTLSHLHGLSAHLSRQDRSHLCRPQTEPLFCCQPMQFANKVCLRRDTIPEEDSGIRLGHHHLCTCAHKNKHQRAHAVCQCRTTDKTSDHSRSSLHADITCVCSEICLPAAPMQTGACSREEPQPKLSPPITIGY